MAVALQGAKRLESLHAARQIVAANAAEGVALPDFVNLAEHVPSSEPWLIDGLMRRGTTLGLFAQFKSGQDDCGP